MELKAKLDKPYTDEERMNFIVEQNHKNGYKIEYTENAIEAWGLTQEEIEQQEEKRTASLTMTALDFLKVLYSLGLTREQVHNYLEEHPEIDEQLKYCQNVYCGVVCQLCPITVDNVTLTEEMVKQIFKNFYGAQNDNI